jgi:hypothetical protein
MRHLSGSEFVDAVEHRLSGTRLDHAEQCAECRTEIDRLRAAIDLAGMDAAEEPSPLFWGHFSSRVSEAVRAEASEPAASWRGWFLRPAALTAAAAAVAVIALIVVTERPRRAASAPPAVSGTAGVVAAPNPAETAALDPYDDLDADTAWAVVRSAAEDIDWEDARAAGLQAQPGAADRMALELTEPERIELMRIVEREMKRSGA